MDQAKGKPEPPIVARGRDAEFWNNNLDVFKDLNDLVRRWPLIRNNPYVWSKIVQRGKELSTAVLKETDSEIAEFYTKMIEDIFRTGPKQVKFGAPAKLAANASLGHFNATKPELFLPMRAPAEPPRVGSFGDRIRTEIEALRARGTNLDGVIEIGHLVRQEWETRIAATPSGRYEALAQETNRLIASAEKYKLGSPEWQKIADQVQALHSEISKQKAALDADVKTKGDHAQELLSEIRAMGYSKGMFGQDNKLKFNAESSADAITAVEAIVKFFPSSWLDQSYARGPMTAKMEGRRGQYSDGMRELQVPLKSERGEDIYSVAAHELGHRMEYSIPGIVEAETQFYRMRTQGESLEKLGPQYDDWEVTRRDEFSSAYMGKDYGGRAWELLSMGQEVIFFGKHGGGDPQFNAFILGLLAVIP